MQPFEELQIEVSAEGKTLKKHKKMEEYEAPLIFEEAFIKTRSNNQVLMGSKINPNGELAQKVDPTGGQGYGIEFQQEQNTDASLKGRHLFVMAHGFGGSKFDLHLV